MRRLTEKLLRKFYLYQDMMMNDVMRELREEAVRSSAEMIRKIAKKKSELEINSEPNSKGALQFFSDRSGIQRFAMQLLPNSANGVGLEFGVDRAASLKFFRSTLNKRGLGFSKQIRIGKGKRGLKKWGGVVDLYGFDSFEGFNELTFQGIDSWHRFRSKGKPPRRIPQGVQLVIGDVSETLPIFLESNNRQVHFVHFDLDVFAATYKCLKALKPALRSGALLLFDEFHGNPGWESGEFKALSEVYQPSEYDFLAFGPNQALIWIK